MFLNARNFNSKDDDFFRIKNEVMLYNFFISKRLIDKDAKCLNCPDRKPIQSFHKGEMILRCA